MLKLTLLGTFLAAMAAGCAVSPETRFHPDTPPTAAHHCLTTGTRIAVKAGECAPGHGRTYSREDLDRTGAFTTAEALRLLDPTIAPGR